jgi:hypothetical protein
MKVWQYSRGRSVRWRSEGICGGEGWASSSPLVCSSDHDRCTTAPSTRRIENGVANQMFGVIGWVRNTDTSIRRLAGGKIQLLRVAFWGDCDRSGRGRDPPLSHDTERTLRSAVEAEIQQRLTDAHRASVQAQSECTAAATGPLTQCGEEVEAARAAQQLAVRRLWEAPLEEVR